MVAAVAEAEAKAKATAQKMNWLQGAWATSRFHEERQVSNEMQQSQTQTHLTGHCE